VKTRAVAPDAIPKIARGLQKSPLFADMPEAQVRMVLEHAQLVALDTGEYLTREGDSSDAFFVVVSGRHDVQLTVGDEAMSVATLAPGDVVGETGLLLDRPRGASVLARTDAKSLRFDSRVFHSLSAKVPAFTLAVCRLLAKRLAAMPHAFANENEAASPPPDGPAPELVEREFCVRHRVVPVRLEGEVLTVGFVDQPSRMVLNNLRGRFPALEVRVVRINPARFESVIKELDAGRGLRKEEAGTETVDDIESLFRRMVEEGASDLHLSAGHPPCWRIDGDIERLPRAAPFGEDDVLELVGKTLTDAARREFEATNDIDYAYAVEGCGRFRMNLFRDNRGSARSPVTSPRKSSPWNSWACPRWPASSAASTRAWSWSPAPPGAASPPPWPRWSTTSTARERATS
jgi:CRP-like cAMP-binding protein